MKTKVTILINGAIYNFGDIGYIDGYVELGNIIHAIVILESNGKLINIPLHHLSVLKSFVTKLSHE